MGYNTEFTGVLKFVSEATASQLAELNSMFGQDCREHPEWGARDLTHINLRLTDDFTGIEWDGSEKTYGLTESVNLVIECMKRKWPDFGVTGTITAQGENVEDRWRLVIDPDGWAIEEKIALTGSTMTCPHCGKHIVLEGVSKGR